jgi:hypothetical protein
MDHGVDSIDFVDNKIVENGCVQHFTTVPNLYETFKLKSDKLPIANITRQVE